MQAWSIVTFFMEGISHGAKQGLNQDAMQARNQFYTVFRVRESMGGELGDGQK